VSGTGELIANVRVPGNFNGRIAAQGSLEGFAFRVMPYPMDEFCEDSAPALGLIQKGFMSIRFSF